MGDKGRKTNRSRGMTVVHPNAAGVDIGSRIHVAAVGSKGVDEPVRTFKTFTDDLQRLADWFEEVGVETVAMESTGVYWIPLFEILQERGLEVIVVNAREVKTVPGRKSDVNDAQWLQRLHQYGLLRASFRPTRGIAELRSYLRQRERLLDYAAAHIQHMQKALTQMNVQLHHVVSDITGVTGLRIIRAIATGVVDPDELAAWRDSRCKSSPETIREALVGHYQREHVFALRQALEMYDAYQAQVARCDQEIEAALDRLREGMEEPSEALPAPRHRTRQPNGLNFDVRGALYALLGVDLTQIHGVGSYLALKIIAECGTDMSRWPSAKHFTSWLALAPANKISGGRLLAIRWAPAGLGNSAFVESSRCGVASRRSDSGQDRYRAGSLLSSIVSSHRQGQGRDRHRPKDRGASIQHVAVRAEVRGPRRFVL